ncbi:hypothetical protein IEQ34_017736 [Dendrobium chrysotoxum]|uniref:RING-type domain-containing protein n=1 Tax=Dendrobium chrysotoxum TaxID=161865 RepID=A0AAV7GC81_DENCH|nr:hypothetical protein IEQ34_017736 [Dendrobium chrysotoxum]
MAIFSRCLLLHYRITSPKSAAGESSPSSTTFHTNVIMIVAVLLTVLICALGLDLNAISTPAPLLANQTSERSRPNSSRLTLDWPVPVRSAPFVSLRLNRVAANAPLPRAPRAPVVLNRRSNHKPKTMAIRSRGLLLHYTITTPKSAAGESSPSSTTFHTNVIIIVVVLLTLLICALGINVIVRCLFHLSGRSSQSFSIVLPGAAARRRAIRKVPVEFFSSDLRLASSGSECAICLTEIELGDWIRLLPVCRHGFHVLCIDPWLLTRPTCPSCRQCPFAMSPKSSGCVEQEESTTESFPSTTFHTNLIMIVVVLLTVLICAVGLNTIISCLFDLSSRSSQSFPIVLPGAAARRRAIQKVPVEFFLPGLRLAGSGSECAICLSEIEPGDRIRLLHVFRHGFHPAADESSPSSTTFHTNVIMIAAVLLAVLICALGLNAIVSCLFHLSGRSSQSFPIVLPCTAARRRAIRKVPVEFFSPDLRLANSGLECAICLTEIKPGDRIRLLPVCRHGFHVRCIDPWLLTRPTCPSCRQCPFASSPKSSGCVEQEEVHRTGIQPLEPEGLEIAYRL